jgi:hypothetical protein
MFVQVKYMLRAGRYTEAHKTVALFARVDTKIPDADPLGNIKTLQVHSRIHLFFIALPFDLQVMWFELESGAAAEAAGMLGPALRHYG